MCDGKQRPGTTEPQGGSRESQTNREAVRTRWGGGGPEPGSYIEGKSIQNKDINPCLPTSFKVYMVVVFACLHELKAMAFADASARHFNETLTISMTGTQGIDLTQQTSPYQLLAH